MHHFPRKTIFVFIFTLLLFSGIINVAQAACCVFSEDSTVRSCSDINTADRTNCVNLGGVFGTNACSGYPPCAGRTGSLPSGAPASPRATPTSPRTQSPVSSSRGPASDTLCWTKSLCEGDSGDFVADTTSPPRCTGSWGFCYPKPEANVYTLQIPIGGVRQVTNISNYVRIGYQAGLGIALTASIVLVMVAGFRWMTAGGNATAIGQAKTMMGNVAIGIVLVLGAYLIFQTINPDITKLTLPRVAKLRPITFNAALWCDNLFAGRPSLQFAFAERPPNVKPPAQIGGDDFRYISIGDMKQKPCGNAYYSIDDPSQACFSRYCADNKVCVLEDDGVRYNCKKVTLAGQITANRQVDAVSLWQVCNDGEVDPGVTFTLKTADENATLYQASSGNYAYYFNLSSLALSTSAYCALNDGEKGYILAIELDDPKGQDDVYALQRSGNNCTVFSASNDVYDLEDELKTANTSIFFQRQDLGTGGLRCDINASGATPM